jgi:N-acetylglucosaminyldiphosphoundecaprenol N-acetyl-beta-D-mannosaminyltransferase
MSEKNACHAVPADGTAINNFLSIPHAVSAIITALKRMHSFGVFTLDIDCRAKLYSDRELRPAYRHSSVVTADGLPIIVLGRVSGIAKKRPAGSDLIWPLCSKASRCSLPVFLVGLDARVLHRAQTRLLKYIPDLEIVGSYATGPNFDRQSTEAAVAIERIRQSGARLCLLAGAPHLDLFAAHCLGKLPGVGMVCVGPAFEFIARTQERVPRFFQEHRLQWLWRLSIDSRRMAMHCLRSVAIVTGFVGGANADVISAGTGRS